MLVKGLLGAAIYLLMDTSGINRLCDVLVPIYTIVAVATVLLFMKQAKAKSGEAEATDARIFTFKKKENTTDLPWKKRFLGKWQKLKREPQEMYEFMVFNGAPSFAANIYKASDFGQNIVTHGEKTENHITFMASGVPSANSPDFLVAEKEEDAKVYNAVDPKGNKIKAKAWWNEAEQACMCKLENPADNTYILQTRKILDGDILFVRMENFKPDGTSKGVDCALKRASS